ncbi:thiamine phosphate synthase [uncultured Helicobacter sp.]|uniref:thiamine phosphate synthase n=1 Tax=uncultured Helicobacter sp. TaxID=175537 RepID=UPI00374E41B2
MKDKVLSGVYGISDEILTPFSTLAHQVQEAIAGGMKIFQFRDKNSLDKDIIEIVQHLMDICVKSNVLFVLNDRVELAIALGVPALHIGESDGDLPLIRKRFKGILGVSSYGDLARAQKMESSGADYVAFGAMFPSPTKPNAPWVGIEILQRAREALEIPICAIGGISRDNIRMLKNADMCAVISSLWNGDPRENAESLSRVFEMSKVVGER